MIEPVAYAPPRFQNLTALDNIRALSHDTPEIYKALFDLSQAIAGHGDLDTLCDSIARSLCRVIAFNTLGLALHDPVHDVLRVHAVRANSWNTGKSIVLPADGDHAVARVWREQRPLALSSPDGSLTQLEKLLGAVELENRGLLLVPLSNGGHRLGILGFGFAAPLDLDASLPAFLQRVSSEVAVSVDGYLARQELLRERDRTRVLLEISNALVSKLSMGDLFAAISDQLSRVVAHDLAVIGLLDKATANVRLSALHSPDGVIQFEPGQDVVSPHGLPAGEALMTGRPVVTSGADPARFPSPLYAKLLALGFRSCCSIPLAGSDGTIGVLDLSRKSGERFTDVDVDLLLQVGRQIAVAVENARAHSELSQIKERLTREQLYLNDEIRFEQKTADMVGESPAFQAMLKAIRVVAPTDATVLIQGETGTGKELVAHALHDLSTRNKRSFIKVNCAAIPASLIESELFGHEKGSFTGAFARKLGRFELAHQGTLFLDEIGEVPLELQAKLLRAIQEQEFERLGGNRTIRVDVRLIAATNRDLKRMVDEGTFRSDLYYRLHVFPLRVPPLRERREDIPLLIRYFTQKHAKPMNRRIESIPSSAIEALTRYEWPGNIRELQNLIERSVILSTGQVLQITIPEAAKSSALPSRRSRDCAERERILQALRESNGRVSGPNGAAARLGLPRTTLQSRMKKLRIEHHYR